MAITYGTNITYGGSQCSAAVYGTEVCSSGSKSGTITGIEEWVHDVELTSNVIVSDGSAIIISCGVNVTSNGYAIIVQDGGILNTRGERLPEQSMIRSILIIT